MVIEMLSFSNIYFCKLGQVHSDDTYVSRSLVQSLLERLDEVQQVFIKLLSDPKSKHLSRESCCLGLAACRGLTEASRTERNVQSGQTSDELNQRLLRAFGQTTNYSGSAMMETSAQAAERRASEREASSESGSTLMETFGADESEVGGGAGGAGVMTEAALGAYKYVLSSRHQVCYATLRLTLLSTAVKQRDGISKRCHWKGRYPLHATDAFGIASCVVL
jgi:proteasome component ECM29